MHALGGNTSCERISYAEQCLTGECDSEGYDEWEPDYQLQKVNAECSCKFAAWIICEGLDEIFYLHSIFYYYYYSYY